MGIALDSLDYFRLFILFYNVQRKLLHLLIVTGTIGNLSTLSYNDYIEFHQVVFVIPTLQVEKLTPREQR